MTKPRNLRESSLFMYIALIEHMIDLQVPRLPKDEELVIELLPSGTVTTLRFHQITLSKKGVAFTSLCLNWNETTEIVNRIESKYGTVITPNSLRTLHARVLSSYAIVVPGPYDLLVKQFGFFLEPAKQLATVPAEDGEEIHQYFTSNFTTRARKFLDEYVALNASKSKRFNIGLRPIDISFQTTDHQIDISHSVGKTALAELKKQFDAYIAHNLYQFQVQMINAIVDGLDIEIGGVKLQSNEIGALIKSSSRAFGKAELSNRIVELANILRGDPEEASQEVNRMLTSQDPEQRQLGKAIAQLLERLPEGAKSFKQASFDVTDSYS